MAHYLYISIGMSSTYHGSLELAQRLRQRGHRVTFASHVDWQEALAPFDFELLRQLDVLKQKVLQHKSPLRTGQAINPFAWYQWFKQRYKYRRESIECSELEELVARCKPDLILVDKESHYAILSTFKLPVPQVLVSFLLDVHFAENIPPLSSHLPLPLNAQETKEVNKVIRDGRKNNKKWRRIGRYSQLGLSRALRALNYQTFNYDDLRELGKFHRFPLEQHARIDQWPRPFTYTHAPTLTLNLAELDFPHEFPQGLHFVGPMINKNRPEPKVSAQELARLQDFVEAHIHKRAELGAELGRQEGLLIYCSMSSFLAVKPQWVEKIVQVFRQRTDWSLVIGLGKLGDAGLVALDDFPANVLTMLWAPQMQVLEVADCVITLGGISAINESIAAGVPMLMFDIGVNDQSGNIARAVHHHLGLRSDFVNADTSNLEQLIIQLVDSKEIHRGVTQFQNLIATYAAEQRAEQFLESQISG